MNIRCRILLLCLGALFPQWLYPGEENRIRFFFAGDLMQHGAQIRSARQADGHYDYDTCFSFIRERVRDSDLAVVNMETSFSGPPYTGYPSFSSPDVLVSAVLRNGFNVFLTANNHILDKGSAGALRTIALYDSMGVSHCGTTPPWIMLEKNGIKVAILNYTYASNRHVPANIFPVNRMDTLLIEKHIREVREKNAACIICCMHWGTEYQPHPSGQQRLLADWLCSKGVTAVIGSHPHVPQPIEIRKRSDGKTAFLVAYSLGNFISNQPEPFSRMGLILSFDVEVTQEGPHIASAWYEWIWTWRPSEDGKTIYHVLPVSDPRLYRNVVKKPDDTLIICKTVKTLRNFMRETSPDINERRRYPPYERENLYFGNHPAFGPLWARQSVNPPLKEGIPTAQNCCPGRTNQSAGATRSD